MVIGVAVWLLWGCIGRVDFRVFDCCWLRLLWCLCGLLGWVYIWIWGTCEVGWVVWMCVRFVCYVSYWRVSGLLWGVALMFLAVGL